MVLVAITVIATCYSMNAQVDLRLNKYSSNIPNFRDTAIEALSIASFILSSQEFKDSIFHMNFMCLNIPFSKKRGACYRRFSGQRVYDSLSRYPDTVLNIIIKKLSAAERLFDPHDQIGASYEGRYGITTRTWYLKETTKTWFASVKYAAHLAHEYCHIRGYYHIKGLRYGEDVAQTVGKLVANIIKRRLKANEPIK